MGGIQPATTTSASGLRGQNLERRLARAVVSLVRDHQELIERHRTLVVTVVVDRKTGELKPSFVLIGKE